MSPNRVQGMANIAAIVFGLTSAIAAILFFA